MNSDDAVAYPVFQKMNCLVAELRRKHSIRHGGRTAALDMPDRGCTYRIRGHFLQLLCKGIRSHDAFCNNDNIRTLSVRTGTVDPRNNIVHIVCDFGYDDNFRSRSYARIQSNIAAMSAHDFNDGDAFVRSHRIAQFIDDIEAGIDRSIEAERIIGIFEIVIDRSRDSDRRNSEFLCKTLRSAERTVSADDDKPFDPMLFKCCNGLPLSLFRKHFKTSRCSQLCAAALNDIGYAPHFHLRHRVVNQSRISAFDSENLDSIINRGTHDRTDRRIHTGRVAAACEKSDSFHNILRIFSIITKLYYIIISKKWK